MLHFNSIKVQLELTVIIVTTSFFIEFQFHKGTIRTEEDGTQKDIYQISIP